MSGRRVHSGVERRWAEEVLHLHALWREGPPRNPNSNPKPKPQPSLRPAPSTTFKKESSSLSAKKKIRRAQKKKKKEDGVAIEAPPSDPLSGNNEWPVPVLIDPKPQASSWDDLKSPPASTTGRPATAEERARAAADSAQRNGLKAAKDFFSKTGSDDDEDEDMEDMDDENGEEAEPFKFFLELFKKDSELREYYEKNHEKGDFFCLVCSGIGAKIGKTYGNAFALVQHASLVSKTKRKESHRALARAICQVIGLDVNRLPSFVLSAGQNLGQSLSKLEKTQEETQKGYVENNEQENVDGKETELIGIADSSEITSKEIVPSAMENEQKRSDTPGAETNEALVDSMPIEEVVQSTNKVATGSNDILSPESKNEDETS